MSATSHLTVASTSDAQVNKRHSSFNLRSTPCDDSSNLLHPPSSPSSASKYLYYVNVEPTRKQSINTTSSTATTTATAASHIRRKLSAISLQVPWSRRTRSPSEDKTSQKAPRMSRDRLLTLDRLFSSGAHTVTDDEQTSPINDVTPLDETLRGNEKSARQAKENGYLRNSSHLKTRWDWIRVSSDLQMEYLFLSHFLVENKFPVLINRRVSWRQLSARFLYSRTFSSLSDRLQYTTKGTKALRLLGDGSGKRNNQPPQDQGFNPKESVINKNAARGNTQRRLLLKNGEVNISR